MAVQAIHTVPSPIIHHNDVQDLTAKYVCHDVQVEPYLQPLSAELHRYKSAVLKDDARFDIKADSFWSCHHHRSVLICLSI